MCKHQPFLVPAITNLQKQKRPQKEPLNSFFKVDEQSSRGSHGVCANTEIRSLSESYQTNKKGSQQEPSNSSFFKVVV